ncbi:MAG TPA: hypothetical protein VGE59_03780 [Patescibacteria group bacterium]
MNPANVTIDISKLQAPIIQGPDLVSVLVGLLSWFLVIAGVVAFIYALYGGFLYLTAGGDSAATVKARNTIINAVIGIVIIFISYSLVRFIIISLNVVQDNKIKTINQQFPTPKPEDTGGVSEETE